MLANKRVFPTEETKEATPKQKGDKELITEDAIPNPLLNEKPSSSNQQLSIEQQHQTTDNAAITSVDPYDSPFTIKEAFTFVIPRKFLPFNIEGSSRYQESFTSKYAGFSSWYYTCLLLVITCFLHVGVLELRLLERQLRQWKHTVTQQILL